MNIAKGIASGLPLGVTCARADVMTWPPGAHASTFGGNPVACAAANATIKLLKESLVANAAAVGAHLMAGIRALQDKHPLIGDVRGKGLMIGVELVRDRQTKVRAVEERNALVQAMFRRGVLVLGAGRNALRLAPPLVLSIAQADSVLRRDGRGAGGSGGRSWEPGARSRACDSRVSGSRIPDAFRPSLCSWAAFHDPPTPGAREIRRRSRRRGTGAPRVRNLARRYRTRHGEIDVVARDGETTVFVEVKARTTGEFGTAAEAVTPFKQRRLVSMATDYLVRHRLIGSSVPVRRA